MAALWLTIWAFDTLGERALGVAGLGLFLMMVGPVLIVSVGADLKQWRERNDDE